MGKSLKSLFFLFLFRSSLIAGVVFNAAPVTSVVDKGGAPNSSEFVGTSISVRSSYFQLSLESACFPLSSPGESLIPTVCPKKV